MKKITLVTGANKGIGLEIARQLINLGHYVILGIRDQQKGEKALKILNSDLAELRVLDVADPGSIINAFEEITKKHVHLDVLINNAGVLTDQGYELADVPMEVFNEIMNINFYGPLHMIRTFLPLLKNASDARVVNLSSGLGALNEMGSGYPGYRISKAAMNAMSAIFGVELSKYGIKVNSMCPGWVKTDMGGPGASRKPEKGAETAVWLATASDIPNGKFLRDKKVIDW